MPENGCDVLSKLIRLFRRYCDHHYVIDLPGFPIVDMDGQKQGQVERLRVGRDSLRIEGWTVLPKLALGRPGAAKWHRPDIKRADVNDALELGNAALTGFNIACFGAPTGAFLCLGDDERLLQLACPVPGRLRRWRSAISIRLSFARDIMRAAPYLFAALLQPSTERKARAKQALGLSRAPVSFQIDPALLSMPETGLRARCKITVIMPVYNAFDVLQEALARITAHTDLPWRLVLVEDCSTDQRVRPFLRRWSEDRRACGDDITLIENGENLGFVQSVNRAFAVALRFGDHAVLVNSDALVPQDWASRLLAPIEASKSVASVTPLSNDAEIFNAPVICQRFDLRPGMADRIDAALREHVPQSAARPAPTGVGFCMAINRQFLKQVPSFDPAFGKGYGEEVDWCQKTARMGGMHLGHAGLFVEHRGGASFGSSAKQQALARSAAMISKRYPDYDQSVQQFIGADPLRTVRCLVGVAELAAHLDEVPVFLAHSLGGGAELYLQDHIARLTEAGKGAVVLRVGGRMRWRFEVYTARGRIFADTEEFDHIRRLLAPAQRRHIHYSCAVGDRYASALPKLMCDLITGSKSRMSFLVHDYFAISPSYCLLDAKGRYAGVPSRDSTDPAHRWTAPNGRQISNAEWRAIWSEAIDASAQIVCFSNDSADVMQRAFPDTMGRIRIRPHRIAPVSPVTRQQRDGPMTLGVLGDIGAQKGARVVQALAKHLPQKSLSKIVIVGRVDPNFALGPACLETGGYQRSDIAALAEKHGIRAWLIPSIWPETFCFTMHEALATGLPVFAFDLGAQGDAARQARNGQCMPRDWQDKPERIIAHIDEVLSHGTDDRIGHQRSQARRNRGFAA